MIKYRLANREDNQQLIELTVASVMSGDTPIRIDRNPDFFKLLDLRGDTKVFVALDGEHIIGSLCVSLQHVYVDGNILPLQYIGDFKVAAAYRNKGIGLQLCNEMADYVISIGADLAFLNVSKGNTKPISFFKNRPNVPDFDNIGTFHIHQFVGRRKNIFHSEYRIESSIADDKIVSFLITHYGKYELGPVITNEKLYDTEVFIIREKNTIIAAMCLSDTMHVKQNVLTRVNLKMKYLLKVLNACSNLFGISKMPLLNEPVRMMYIKYLAVNFPERQLVKLLINYARNIVYQKSYSFASIGLHEKDPLNKYLPGGISITFNSVGMLLSIKDNKQLINQVKQGIPFEDYSLV